MKRLAVKVKEQCGRIVSRATIQRALERLGLPWKNTKKRLGRTRPERRTAIVRQIQGLLQGVPERQRFLIDLDEAHIHQNVDSSRGVRARAGGAARPPVLHIPNLMPVEMLWGRLREDTIQHRCNVGEEELVDRIEAFLPAINANPLAVAH